VEAFILKDERKLPQVKKAAAPFFVGNHCDIKPNACRVRFSQNFFFIFMYNRV
jgi:hypothetical protein